MTDSAIVRNAPDRDSITVFFPCYNEQASIRRVYESATKVLAGMGVEYEIILVDDGSTDQTSGIMDAIAAADSRVVTIHHSTNLGYGCALQSGLRAATKTLVFYSDGDGQFDLGEFPPLMPLMKRFDIVSCFRINRRENLFRKFNSWCWTRLVCLLFHLRLKDVNCAFKLYHRRIFDDMELRSSGALINAEILARAARRGCTITQAGVHHFPRIGGRSTGANPGVIFRAFCELAELYKQIK